MADFGSKIVQFLIFCFILASIEPIEGKGRGGGGRGRGGRVRFGGGSTGRKSVSRFSKPKVSRPWFTKAIFIGTLYGLTAYKTRRRWHSHPNREPTTCKNFVAPNGTHYGYFICPMYHQDDDLEYCCGPERKQYCCRFGDDPGRVAGVVIGIILFIAFVAIVIACCCWCKKKKKEKGAIGRVLKTPTQGSTPQAPCNYHPVHPPANHETAVGYNPGSGATYGLPTEAGTTPYPAGPPPPYPAQALDPPVDPATGPGYPPAQPTDGAMYPPGPGYPPEAPGPGYPTEGTGPGYPPEGTGPGYPPEGTGPGYPPEGTGPGYPPEGTGPGYPPEAPEGPWYPKEAQGPGYPPADPGFQPGTGANAAPDGLPYPVSPATAPYPTTNSSKV